MNIKEFKVGDIITRNEACKVTYESKCGDGSWTGDRLILKGHDPISKIIFCEHGDGCFNGDITHLSYARDPWDEGWSYYPETMFQKIKKIFNPSPTSEEAGK